MSRKDLPELRGLGSVATYDLLANSFVSLERTDLISGYLDIYQYTGGAHGNSSFQVINVGMFNGHPREIRLDDLFINGMDGQRELAMAVWSELTMNPNADWVKDGFTSFNELTKVVNNFVLTANGFKVLIEPYVVGPYAAGRFFVDVPYNQVMGLDEESPIKTFLKK